MKSTVKEGKCEKEIVYPCLMKSSSNKKLVYFFLNKNTGFCIAGGNSSIQIGDTDTYHSQFTLYTGSVCLEND